MLRTITLTLSIAMLAGCGDIDVTGGDCLIGSTIACTCGPLAGTQTCVPPGQLGDCVCEGDASGSDASDTTDVEPDKGLPDTNPGDTPPGDTLPGDTLPEDGGPDDTDTDSQPQDVTPDTAPDIPAPCDPPAQQTCAGTCATCPTGVGVLQTGCVGNACEALECTDGHYLCAGDCCAWTIQVPDQSGPLGERMKLSLTPDDKLVFAYHFSVVSPPMDGVRVLIQSGISWTTSEVTTGGLYFLGLDVGTDGTIAVATDTGGQFGATVYVYQANGTWKERFWPDATVNPITIVAAHPAVDSGGQPQIILRDEGIGTGWLKHASLASSGANWETTTLANNVSLAVLPNNESIVVDSGDQPHVAYHDGVSNELKHRFLVGNSWETRTVAVGETFSPSIAVAGDDTPRVAYVHSSGMLRYATFDGAWSSEDVVAVSSTQVALALDSKGTPFIAYLNDDKNGRLELARLGPDGWVISVVDAKTTIGAIDLVVTANGEPAIGYEDAGLHRIKLATP